MLFLRPLSDASIFLGRGSGGVFGLFSEAFFQKPHLFRGFRMTKPLGFSIEFNCLSVICRDNAEALLMAETQRKAGSRMGTGD